MEAAFVAASSTSESRRPESVTFNWAFVNARANASLRNAAFSCDTLSSTCFKGDGRFCGERDFFFAFFIPAIKAAEFAHEKLKRMALRKINGSATIDNRCD